MTYDNIKSHKKPGLQPLSRRYIFGKTTGGVYLTPTPIPSSLRVKGDWKWWHKPIYMFIFCQSFLLNVHRIKNSIYTWSWCNIKSILKQGINHEVSSD